MKNHSHYKDFIDLRGDGRIVIYKRQDHKNPSFTARFNFPQRNDYIIRSTKTRIEHEARSFAENLYYELEGKLHRGERIDKYPFEKVFIKWAAHRRTTEKEKVYTESDIRAAELYILSFFSKYDISDINSDAVNSFFDYRQSSPAKPPSVATLKQESRRLRNILTYAKERGDLTKIPTLPSFKGKKNARPDFNRNEWRVLYRYMRQHVKEVINNKAHYRDRYYLQQYILILANSGIRVGEARNLKWQDISSTKTVDGSLRTVLLVDGKTGTREVVCNEQLEKYLHRLFEFRVAESGNKPSLSEYVFCHPNGTPIKNFKRSFNSLLEKTNLTFNSKGQKRVIYSLRHTYAAMRIQEGVSVYQLAVNMGTSVEMIERYYGKKRTTTALAATEITKMNRDNKINKTPNKKLPWK